jgi:hypothetical protein
VKGSRGRPSLHASQSKDWKAALRKRTQRWFDERRRRENALDDGVTPQKLSKKLLYEAWVQMVYRGMAEWLAQRRDK